jgi:hypothetical protein
MYNVVHNDYEAQITSYTVGTGGPLPGVKWPGREADETFSD